MSDIAVITIPIEEWKATTAMLKGLCTKVDKLTKQTEKELLTIPEVRELLSLSKTTMERYINDGIFEIVRPTMNPSGKRYIKRSEIENKLNNGEISNP